MSLALSGLLQWRAICQHHTFHSDIMIAVRDSVTQAYCTLDM